MLNSVRSMKESIKNLVMEQRALRVERKSTFTGERWYSSDHRNAAEVRKFNSRELRSMYMAYAILRGRPVEAVEVKTREGNFPDMSYVDSLVSAYRQLHDDIQEAVAS